MPYARLPSLPQFRRMLCISPAQWLGFSFLMLVPILAIFKLLDPVQVTLSVDNTTIVYPEREHDQNKAYIIVGSNDEGINIDLEGNIIENAFQLQKTILSECPPPIQNKCTRYDFTARTGFYETIAIVTRSNGNITRIPFRTTVLP